MRGEVMNSRMRFGSHWSELGGGRWARLMASVTSDVYPWKEIFE